MSWIYQHQSNISTTKVQSRYLRRASPPCDIYTYWIPRQMSMIYSEVYCAFNATNPLTLTANTKQFVIIHLPRRGYHALPWFTRQRMVYTSWWDPRTSPLHLHGHFMSVQSHQDGSAPHLVRRGDYIANGRVRRQAVYCALISLYEVGGREAISVEDFVSIRG